VAIAIVCKAVKPPAINKIEATIPSVDAQNILWITGGLGFPPAVIMSMTSEPESEEVTKNVTTTHIARKLTKGRKKSGKEAFSAEISPKKTNSDCDKFSLTAAASLPSANNSI